MKRQTIETSADLDRLEAIISKSAEASVRSVSRLLAATDPLIALARLKFSAEGNDPLNPDRPLNLVEQLHQSFTYLASIGGARWLVARHPECLPLILNLGTASGSDIQSRCGQFVAEVFAATHPGSNDKLKKDIAKVRKSGAAHRFVFFLSPVAANLVADSEITVVQLDHSAVGALRSAWKDA